MLWSVRIGLCFVMVGKVFQVLGERGFKPFDFIWALFLAIVFCFSVCRLEALYRTFKESDQIQGIWYAVYFTVSLLFLFYPLDHAKTTVTEFKRMIGAGIIADYDVSKTIHYFTNWFVCFALCFPIFLLLANDHAKQKKSDERQIVSNYLDKVVVLANLDLIFRGITYFYDSSLSENVYYDSTSLLRLLVVSGLVYLWLELDKNIAADQYLQMVFCGYAVSYPVSVLFFNGRMLIKVQAVTLCFMFVLAKGCKKIFQKEGMHFVLKSGVLVLCLFPFMTSFYTELINIMNQHRLFVAHPKKYYVIAAVLLIVLWLFLAFIMKKKGWMLSKWKNWSYPWLVFGISCLSVQLPLESVYHADIFETANSSILISDFLNFGSIPIVEHYGGHMMTGVWEGLIYAFINQDYAGAVFSPYAVYLLPLLAVLFFCLVKCVWNADIAVWVTLLFPFYDYWSYFGLGMLLCLAVIGFVRKNTYSRALLIWAAFAWCVLYRLDLGYAFGMACIAALIIYVLISHNKSAAKQLAVSFLAVGAAGVIVWCMLCVCKNLNPLERAMEFLQISFSNANWAYNGIGNYGNMVFAWCYLFVPFMMEAGLLYTICSSKFRNRLEIEKCMLLLIFGISYFVNFSRGLVRHSLAEMNTTVIIWSAYVFLAIFISCIKEKQSLFLIAFTLLILCHTLFLQDSNFTARSILDTASYKTGNFVEEWTMECSADEEVDRDGTLKTYWEKLSESAETVNRVQWEESLAGKIAAYRIILETLLEQDETYMDFMNHSFLYSAIGRKDPVYVSQVPGQLSGEYTQEQFIKQIQNHMDDIPVVLMPFEESGFAVSLDGISNVYRYYKVAEFIYNHYRPLCSYEEFAVWCLPKRYDEMKQKLDRLKKDVTNDFLACETLKTGNCRVIQDKINKKIEIACTGADPMIDGIQTFVDLDEYDRGNIRITIEYESSVDGNMQIYYTTDAEEEYTEEKSVSVEVTGNGWAEFIVPVTKNSRLRLDIPEKSTTIIQSIRVAMAVDLISWGYDGALQTQDEAGNYVSAYNGSFHNYSIGHLPRIWAEFDKKHAIKNKVVTELKPSDSYYFMEKPIGRNEHGNYLMLSVNYKGEENESEEGDTSGYVDAVVKLGNYDNGKFNERYQYTITLKEGYHQYLIRISSDYYWYSSQIHAVGVSSEAALEGLGIAILEGD